jgi:hypothetical protein
MAEPTDQGTSDTTPAPAAGSTGDTHVPATGTAPNPQSVAAPSEQTPAKSGEGQPPEGLIPQAKYDGAMRTLAQRDQAIRDFEAQVQDLTGKLKESETSTGALQADFQTQIAGLGEQVTTLTGERDTAVTSLTAAQADLVKFNALREFPDLLSMADQIPSLPDAEVMKEHLTMLQKGVHSVAEELAQKKTAGMTPGATVPATGGKPAYGYADTQAWLTAMDEALADPVNGSAEFKKLEEAFFKWQQGQGG